MFHQKNFFHISQSPNLQNEKMTLDRLLINLIVGFVKRTNKGVINIFVEDDLSPLNGTINLLSCI